MKGEPPDRDTAASPLRTIRDVLVALHNALTTPPISDPAVDD